MAQSGWYDDPDGTPGRLRYFDGTQWTSDTMPVPGTTAGSAGGPSAGTGTSASGLQDGHPGPSPAPYPPAAANPSSAPSGQPTGPTPPYGSAPYGSAPAGSAPYGSAPYGSAPYGTGPQGTAGPGAYPGQAPAGGPVRTAPQRPRRRGNLLLGAAGGLAVAYLLVHLFGNAAGGPTTTTTSTSTTTRPATTRTTPLPTAFPTVSNPPLGGPTLAPASPGASGSLPRMADCVDPQGRSLTDLTITVTIPTTWTAPTTMGEGPFECSQTAGRNVTSDWQMSAAVGSTPADQKSAQQTAEDVWAWNARSNYGNAPVKTTVTSQDAVTMGGLKGYQLTGEVRVSGVQGVQGDVVHILSLVRADGSHSTLITGHTIGDAKGAAEMDQLWKSLKVKA